MCFVATLFFMMGCLGYSSSSGTIQDVAWIIVDQGSSTMFYALKGAFYKGGGDGVSVPYSECADTTKACSTCEVSPAVHVLQY